MNAFVRKVIAFVTANPKSFAVASGLFFLLVAFSGEIFIPFLVGAAAFFAAKYLIFD